MYVCVKYANLHLVSLHIECYILYVYVCCVRVRVYICREVFRVCVRTVLPTNGSRVGLQQYREKKPGIELFYEEKKRELKRKKERGTMVSVFFFFFFARAGKTITITVHRVEASNTLEREIFRLNSHTVKAPLSLATRE